MWAKTSRLLVLGFLFLAGCGSSHPAASADPTAPTTSASKEIDAFNEACKSLGPSGSLGDAPVCECALNEVEAQTNPISFAFPARQANIG